MPLTVTEIHRWNSESVREVFHLTRVRSQAMFAAARDLQTLSVFESWEGEAAKAAQHSVDQTRQDLDAHGNEALAVALAAGNAADGIDRVQAGLRSLENDAESAGFDIDPVTGAIMPLPGSRHGREAAGVLQQLSSRLKTVLEQANSVDMELAMAINMAVGDVPTPTTNAVPRLAGDNKTNATTAAERGRDGATPADLPNANVLSATGDFLDRGSEQWRDLLGNEKWGPITPGGATARSAARTADDLKQLAKFGKRFGLLGTAVEGVTAWYDVQDAIESGSSLGGAVLDVAPKAAGGIGGGMAGAAYGAELGATLGLAGGPVGMVIGAGVGGALGGFLGSKAGEVAGEGFTTATKAVGGWVASVFD